MDTTDAVTAELRKLREGPGLTAGRLVACGATLSALGTTLADEGEARLLAQLVAMPDSEFTRALRVDYAVEAAALIGRPLHERERAFLGERRSAYAETTKRDVKTLARWSDRAVAELRTRLINDSFNGRLYIVAAVDNDRIAGSLCSRKILTNLRMPRNVALAQNWRTITMAPHPPCIVYAFPRDWTPRSLTLVVVFRKTTPSAVWGSAADHLLAASFAPVARQIPLHDDTAARRFDPPRQGKVYSVWWLFTPK